MRSFVRQHARQFILVAHRQKQSAVNGHESAGDCEGVDVGIADDEVIELVLAFLRLAREAMANLLGVLLDFATPCAYPTLTLKPTAAAARKAVMDLSADMVTLEPWSVGPSQSSLKTEAKSKNFGGVVRQTRALAPHQRDMSGKRPAVKSVYHVREPGRGLREVGRVNLRNIAQTHHFGAGTRPGDQGLHLLGGQILSFVNNDEAVQKRAAAHEIQRADLDAVP